MGHEHSLISCKPTLKRAEWFQPGTYMYSVYQPILLKICMDCATFDRFGLVNQEIECFEAKKIKKNCFDNLV